MRTTRIQSGFTIVETLVAITVLMIAIAGPLVVASKGLFGALASKDQLVASYLAQESMEQIKNTRDNTLFSSSGATWDTLSSGCTSASQSCDASAIDSGANAVITTCSNGCPIYVNASGYLSHIAVGQQTAFRRYFYVTAGNPSNNGNEILVTVVVTWNEGTTPYTVTLSSELTNSTR